jgi:hypothetical protein
MKTLLKFLFGLCVALTPFIGLGYPPYDACDELTNTPPNKIVNYKTQTKTVTFERSSVS